MRRCLDGEANDDDVARFEEALRGSPGLRKNYLSYLNVESGLVSEPKRDKGLEAGGRRRGHRASATPPIWSRIPNGVGALKLAVALLIVAGVLSFSAHESNKNRGSFGVALDNASAARPVDSGVAVLTRVAGLEGPASEDWRVGDTISPGAMSWDDGHLQLEFYEGATMLVAGPAAIEILDDSRVVCQSGRFRAHVPELARSFATLAMGFEIVSVGSDFGLSFAENGSAKIHVFEGAVELHERDSAPRSRPRIELQSGESLLISPEGDTEPIAAQESDFATFTQMTQLTDARRLEQMVDWRAFRDSLRMDPRVVAYFPFDRPKEKDRLLLGYAADEVTLTGAIVGCEWSEGRWPGKSSLQFKRPGDRVRVRIPGEFESFTYSVWLRVDGLDRMQNSILLTDGSGQNGIHWQIRKDGDLILGMRYAKGGWRNYRADAVFSLFRLGQWVHLATVYDADKGRVTHYVNGERIYREPLKRNRGGSLKIGSATIGNWSLPGRQPERSSVRNFNGRIDELIVFDVALSGKETRRIYEKGRP